MNQTNSMPPSSCATLLSALRRDNSPESGKLTFQGVDGHDVYNITAPFEIDGETVIAGRVERREVELSEIVFFVERDGVWTPHPAAQRLRGLQGPCVTFVDDELVLGGVRFPVERPNGEKIWLMEFYRGRSLTALRLFLQGPDKMKDIRLKQLPDGRIAVLTRPQGAKGGRGQIGFFIAERLDAITAGAIEAAPVFTGMFRAEEWGGANEAHLLPDGRLGVLGHIAYFDEAGCRHYYPMIFTLDPKTGQAGAPQIIAQRDEFPSGPTKRPDLADVIFSGGLVRHEDGTAMLYAGLSDTEAGWIRLPDPFFSNGNHWPAPIGARRNGAAIALATLMLAVVPSFGFATSAAPSAERGEVQPCLPPYSLHHLQTLTDGTSVHEFAAGTGVAPRSDYCAEDTARALAAVTLHEQVTGKTDGRALAAVYLQYLQHSLQSDGQMLNRFSGMEATGDSYGRVLWGLGYASRFSPDPAIAAGAKRLFDTILPGHETKLGGHLLARAYALQGLAYRLLLDPSDKALRSALTAQADALTSACQQHRAPKWEWYCDRMTYDSGRVPLALLLAYQATNDARYLATARATLDFLLAVSFPAPGDVLSLVGNQGWFSRGGEPARFDQQPIDAAAMVEVCVTAWRVTSDARYAQAARRSFDWFLGRNIGHASLYDPATGGCRDGLGANGANHNEGGESTIMYLIARGTVQEALENREP